MLEKTELKYGQETIFQCPPGQHAASERCVSLIMRPRVTRIKIHVSDILVIFYLRKKGFKHKHLQPELVIVQIRQMTAWNFTKVSIKTHISPIHEASIEYLCAIPSVHGTMHRSSQYQRFNFNI